MADKPKWRRKRDDEIAQSAKPHLEQGEEVREIFMGQSRHSPIWDVALFVVWAVLTGPSVLVDGFPRRMFRRFHRGLTLRLSILPWPGSSTLIDCSE